jgi:hypothetical protein
LVHHSLRFVLVVSAFIYIPKRMQVAPTTATTTTTESADPVDEAISLLTLGLDFGEGGETPKDKSEARIEDFKKTLGHDSEQKKRREHYLKRQKKSRKDYTEYARSLALEEPAAEEQEEPEQPSTGSTDDQSTSGSEESEEVLKSMLTVPTPTTPTTSTPSQQVPSLDFQTFLATYSNEGSSSFSSTSEEDKGKRKRKEQAQTWVPGERDVKTSCVPLQAIYASKKAERQRRQEERLKKQYSDSFMLPESMSDIPEDFLQNWVAVPYPSGGKRCMVISAKGRTTSRSRNGAIMSRFPSALPGGRTTKGAHIHPYQYCILDCVFHEPSLTYYVLDVVCWKGNLYYDCDTTFRNYWTQTKLEETDGIHTISRTNSYRFIQLPIFECAIDELSNLASIIEQQQKQTNSNPFEFEKPENLDTNNINNNMNIIIGNNSSNNNGKFEKLQELGKIESLLFYHKETQYTFGVTPLVLKLDINRLEELLEALQLRLSMQTS